MTQDSVRLEVLNTFERGARKILHDHPPFRDGDCDAHVLIVGAGRLGENLLVQAAHQWRHFARDSCRTVKITIVDRNAELRHKYFALRYPFLETVCEIMAVEMDVTDPMFFRGDFLRDETGEIDVTAMYVCLDNDTLGVNTALNLLEATSGSNAPIAVRMSYHGGLAALLQDYIGKHWGDESDDPALETDWELLPQNIRDSFRRLADQIVREFHKVGFVVEPLARSDADVAEFSDDEIDLLARLKHDYYTEERLSGRWIYLPCAGDWAGDTSPSPVSWQFRKPEVKKVFRSMVREFPEFLATMDFQVSRMPSSSSSQSTGAFRL